MHKNIQAHFSKLEEAIRTTGIPADRQKVVSAAIARLGALYTGFRQTNESRYGDEITRGVQSVLKELEACPEAQKLDASFREGLRLLHDRLGVPALSLKALAVPPKARKRREK
jgi:hypothetical protein